jgi:hypothetical protein
MCRPSPEPPNSHQRCVILSNFEGRTTNNSAFTGEEVESNTLLVPSAGPIAVHPQCDVHPNPPHSYVPGYLSPGLDGDATLIRFDQHVHSFICHCDDRMRDMDAPGFADNQVFKQLFNVWRQQSSVEVQHIRRLSTNGEPANVATSRATMCWCWLSRFEALGCRQPREARGRRTLVNCMCTCQGIATLSPTSSLSQGPLDAMALCASLREFCELVGILIAIALLALHVIVATADPWPRPLASFIHIAILATSVHGSDARWPNYLWPSHNTSKQRRPQTAQLAGHGTLTHQSAAAVSAVADVLSTDAVSVLPIPTTRIPEPSAMLVMYGQAFRYGLCGMNSKRKVTSSQRSTATSIQPSVHAGDSSIGASNPKTIQRGSLHRPRQQVPAPVTLVPQQHRHRDEASEEAVAEDEEEEDEVELRRPPPPSASPGAILQQLGSRLATSRLNIGTRRTSLQGISETRDNAYLPRRVPRQHPSVPREERDAGARVDNDLRTDDVLPPKRNSLKFRWQQK